MFLCETWHRGAPRRFRPFESLLVAQWRRNHVNIDINSKRMKKRYLSGEKGRLLWILEAAVVMVTFLICDGVFDDENDPNMFFVLFVHQNSNLAHFLHSSYIINLTMMSWKTCWTTVLCALIATVVIELTTHSFSRNLTIQNALNLSFKSTPSSQRHRHNTTTTNKPWFLLHVGPPKTATTTLQIELAKLNSSGVLEQDNYVYLGSRFARPENHPNLGHDCIESWRIPPVMYKYELQDSTTILLQSFQNAGENLTSLLQGLEFHGQTRDYFRWTIWVCRFQTLLWLASHARICWRKIGISKSLFPIDDIMIGLSVSRVNNIANRPIHERSGHKITVHHPCHPCTSRCKSCCTIHNPTSTSLQVHFSTN